MAQIQRTTVAMLYILQGLTQLWVFGSRKEKTSRKALLPYCGFSHCWCLRQGTDQGFLVMANCTPQTAVFESQLNGLAGPLGWDHTSPIEAESAETPLHCSPTQRDCVWPCSWKLLTHQHLCERTTTPRITIIWSNILCADCGLSSRAIHH